MRKVVKKMSDILKRNAEVRILYSDEYGLKSSSYCYMKCECCGKTFKHYLTENIYKSDFDGKTCCSYNCRSHYYKKHWKERQDYYYKKENQLELLRLKQARYEKERYEKRKQQEQVNNQATQENAKMGEN